jgi:hypothetical protein
LEILFVEKRKKKTAYWGMQGDLEISDPMGQGGEWGFTALFALPEGRDAFQMQTGIPWEKKCLLDLLQFFLQ